MSGSKVPQPYQPTGQAQADQGYQGIFTAAQPYAQALPGQVVPGVSSAVSNLVSNPYAAGYQTGASTAGGTYNAFAPQATAAGTSLFGAGNQGIAAGNTVLGQAFDPQNALYARQFQQLMDQQNAINAQSGVGQTPYGAGIAGQAAENFNIDWINNLLNRESTGIGAFNAANAGAGQDFTTGAGLGQTGAQFSQLGGQTPYDAYGNINSNVINAYNALSGATQGAIAPGMNISNELAQYLGLGQSATGLAQAGQAQQYAQNQSMFQGLGQLAGYGIGMFA